MSIQKKTTWDVSCEGPCHTERFVVDRPDKIPASWSVLKIVPAKILPGHKPKYRVATLCPECSEEVIGLLKSGGFDLATVNFGDNDGQ